MATKFVSALTGPEMDQALTDMAYHNSEAYAVGTRNGVAVGSSDVTYHNNSKYWAEQVYGYTDRAEDAANRAEAAVPASTEGAVFFSTAQTLTTAQQGQAKANIMAGGTNPNLLDNCYFVGGGSQLGYGIFPINQKGQTSYSGAGRMIDRWIGQNSNGGMTLTADGIVFTNSGNGYGYIRHTLTRVTQRNGWTLSILTADGTVYQSSNTNDITLPSGLLLYWASSNALTFRVPANLAASETIAAIKYEAAPYSTILNDAKPDFLTELQNAQAHYLKLTDITFPAIANASGVSLTTVIPTPQMSPTTTVLSISIGWVRKAGYQATPSVSVSNVTLKVFPAFVFMQIAHGLSNITPQDTYWVNFASLQLSDGI